MRFSFIAICAACGALVSGCSTFEQVKNEFVDLFRDRIVHESPQIVKPLTAGAKIYLERPVGAATTGIYARNGYSLMNEFARALRAHGAEVTQSESLKVDFRSECARAEKAGCDWVLFVRIDRWEYGDSGFSGEGERNDVYFSVVLADARRRRVVDRASIEVKNGFGRSKSGGSSTEEAVEPVITRYVNYLFTGED